MTDFNLMDKIVSLCKRRGFVYPGSEIYGGLGNSYCYGPLGVELLRNIKSLWWQTFVHDRPEIYGIQSSIIMHPRVWEASGHTESFNDALVECQKCHKRFRADHLVEQATGEKVEGKALKELAALMRGAGVACPECGSREFTEPRQFNLLFRTTLGSVPEESSTVYLRGETAQGMFVAYKNVLDSIHPELPFGIAQIGKAFRNEITLGNFIFRTFEFEMMEIEYFIRKENWESHFERWQKDMWNWLISLGVSEKKLRWRRHTEEELSHYSKRTEDIEYDFPFGGFKELYGLAYRTDFDLKRHSQFSGADLHYRDRETGEEFFPHVVEPTFGVGRTMLVLLLEAYREEEINGKRRVYLALDPRLAPYKVAVFPLLANKPELVKKAREVYSVLQDGDAPPGCLCNMPVAWDARGNIGKRYYAQDEIGTPWCVTVDYQTLEDDTVTVRDRDTTKQERIAVSELADYFIQTSMKKLHHYEN